MNVVPHSRPWLTAADNAAVVEALASNMIGGGSRTAEFERLIANWIGALGAVAVASGTSALALALRAVGIGSGDEVIVPSYSCRSLLTAVNSVGATPRPCDVGENWLVEPIHIEATISEHTKAIIIPHLYGLWSDTSAFHCFGIPLIEDFAQALGAQHERIMDAQVSVFSFHPTKCLTTGEGGMCATRDPALLTRLRELRCGDGSGNGVFPPLSDVASALGLSQLSRYDSMLGRRKEIAAHYRAALGTHIDRLAPWHRLICGMDFRFPLRVTGGLESVARQFAERGVLVRRGVDELIHRLLNLTDRQFPTSVRLFSETVSIPLHPSLSAHEVKQCSEAIRRIFASSD
jgi:perosamine synthetase